MLWGSSVCNVPLSRMANEREDLCDCLGIPRKAMRTVDMV